MNWKEKVDTFLENDWKKQKIIVVYGPTACWKTSLSIELAKYINSEVISTDSRQIFKGMDIGTGKITQEEKQWITHYMIDIITPDKKYSVGEFHNEAQIHIKNIFERKKIPILCGGTGLYIDSLIYDFEIPKVPANETFRKNLEKSAELYGNEYVYQQLLEIDPEYAPELHPNNLPYVIRALEIKLLTWKSKKDFRKERKLEYDILFLTPFDWDRDSLYQRINKRIEMMFDDGLIEEVKKLLIDYKRDDFGMQSIWYLEVIDYLEWNISLEECVRLVQQHNRNYAKRQLTWFKKYKEYI